MKILLLILTLLLIPICSASLTDFNVVSFFPDEIVAGSVYSAEIEFTGMEPINVNVSLTIDNSNYNDWIINFVLNNSALQSTETQPGVFVCNMDIPLGHNELEIIAFTNPALIPGAYNFSITIDSLVEEEVIGGGKKKNRPNYYYYFPQENETTAPTPTSTELSPAISESLSKTLTEEPTEEPTKEIPIEYLPEKKFPLILIIGGIGYIIILLGIIIYCMMKKK